SRVGKPVYANTNAIYVVGGNLDVRGDSFNVNFRGLYNDFGDDVYKVAGDPIYFDNLVVKSFAVACDGGNVDIEKANIVTTVGGGVKVSGGTINLGK
ncbi:MAG: hypothetical protein OSJ83_14220, partial [Clostridia bacterium]|nr:hypothetical protein [Clostridia bacterium]